MYSFNCQIDVEAPAYVRTARYAPARYALNAGWQLHRQMYRDSWSYPCRHTATHPIRNRDKQTAFTPAITHTHSNMHA